MATSVKRMVIMFILINLVFGLAINLAGDTSTTTLSQTTNRYSNWTEDFRDNYEDAEAETSTTQFDKTYGDVRFGLGKVFGLLKTGVISPFTGYECELENCGTAFQQSLNDGMRMTIGIINILMIFEIVYLIYSKKYD